MNLDEVEVILDRALERQKDKGVEIVRGTYGVDVGAFSGEIEFENRHSPPCACAFGAWSMDSRLPIETVGEDIDGILRRAAGSRLGFDAQDYTAFLNGFDDGDTAYGDARLRAVAEMGKRLSEKYVGKFDVSEAL